MKKFEYEQDFITEFDISFCSACNSKYEQSKTRKIKKTSQTNTQVQDNCDTARRLQKNMMIQLQKQRWLGDSDNDSEDNEDGEDGEDGEGGKDDNKEQSSSPVEDSPVQDSSVQDSSAERISDQVQK